MSAPIPVLCDHYKTTLLDQLRPLFATHWLHLFVNAVDITGLTTFSAFVEPSFPGYAPVLLTGWTASYLNANLDAQTDPDLVVFRMTGPSPVETVFGWFVTDISNSLVRSALGASGPQLMGGVGAVYPVMASVTLLTALCPDGSGSGSGSGGMELWLPPEQVLPVRSPRSGRGARPRP